MANSTGEGKGLSADVMKLPVWTFDSSNINLKLIDRESVLALLAAQSADSALRLKLEKLGAKWRKKADGMDDGRGVTLCAELAAHYRNRADELSTLLTEDSSQSVKETKNVSTS